MDASVLAVGSFAEVGSGALEVRDAPNLNAPVLETLPRPAVVHVEGSIPLDGAVWYRIQYKWARLENVFGWVHESRAAPQLRVIDLECPRDVDNVANLAGLLPPELLRCFAGKPLRLTHVVLTDAPPIPRLFVGIPDWLASPSRVWIRGVIDGPGLPVHLAPGLGVVPAGQYVDVTAHVDDAASVDCVRNAVNATVSQETPAEQILWCRQELVIDAVAQS